MTGRKIGYIMSRFPHLPETFILREMTELEKLGLEIFLFPLIRQNPGVIHHEAQPWIEKAVFTPYLSLEIIFSFFIALFTVPIRLISAFFLIIFHNLSSPNFLFRAILLFPKSVHISMLAKKNGVDHFHVHYATHPALVAWIIQYLTGISYSVTIHAHDIFIRQTMLAEKLGQAQFVIAISEFNKRFVSENVSHSLEDKIHVVHCGIRPEAYTRAPSFLSEKDQAYQIISIGSLQEYKGQIFLIQACSILRESGMNFHCHLIGEGEMRPELEAAIQEYGLGNLVTMHGGLSQEAVARHLVRGNCYVQPSIIARNKKMEGIPVAIMEAMAANLPVIATDISGIPEIVIPKRTGLLVEEKNPQKLADAILYIYNHPVEAETMAQAARQLVRDDYNLVVNTRKIYNIFMGE